MVSEDNSFNLGVVQISPQATGNGSLSILYVNGDRCGDQRFSTRIVFECAQTSVSVHLSRKRLLGGYLYSHFPLILESSVLFKVCVYRNGGIASV
jgi:hypothetical protein